MWYGHVIRRVLLSPYFTVEKKNTGVKEIEKQSTGGHCNYLLTGNEVRI